MSNYPLPKPHRTPMPKVTDDPMVPQHIKDQIAPPDKESIPHLARVEQWRRYDRRIFGQLVMPDGSASSETVQIEGLIVKLDLKTNDLGIPNYVAMDTGHYYVLGHRAYAGT